MRHSTLSEQYEHRWAVAATGWYSSFGEKPGPEKQEAKNTKPGGKEGQRQQQQHQHIGMDRWQLFKFVAQEPQKFVVITNQYQPTNQATNQLLFIQVSLWYPLIIA